MFIAERKILVVTGYPRKGQSQVETFNSIGQAKQCNSIEKYPLEIDSAQGGVVNDQVVICGGSTGGGSDGAISQCYKLSQNGQWSQQIVFIAYVTVDGAG